MCVKKPFFWMSCDKYVIAIPTPHHIMDAKSSHDIFFNYYVRACYLVCKKMGEIGGGGVIYIYIDIDIDIYMENRG